MTIFISLYISEALKWPATLKELPEKPGKRKKTDDNDRSWYGISILIVCCLLCWLWHHYSLWYWCCFFLDLHFCVFTTYPLCNHCCWESLPACFWYRSIYDDFHCWLCWACVECVAHALYLSVFCVYCVDWAVCFLWICVDCAECVARLVICELFTCWLYADCVVYALCLSVVVFIGRLLRMLCVLSSWLWNTCFVLVSGVVLIVLRMLCVYLFYL